MDDQTPSQARGTNIESLFSHEDVDLIRRAIEAGRVEGGYGSGRHADWPLTETEQEKLHRLAARIAALL